MKSRPLLHFLLSNSLSNAPPEKMKVGFILCKCKICIQLLCPSSTGKIRPQSGSPHLQLCTHWSAATWNCTKNDLKRLKKICFKSTNSNAVCEPHGDNINAISMWKALWTVRGQTLKRLLNIKKKAFREGGSVEDCSKTAGKECNRAS